MAQAGNNAGNNANDTSTMDHDGRIQDHRFLVTPKFDGVRSGDGYSPAREFIDFFSRARRNNGVTLK